VFDVIGKRRIFYIISLALTIPGLVFILLTPFTEAGLKFTIDYTGGTRWAIRFADPAVTPDQVEDVFAGQGLGATALRTGSSGFLEVTTDAPIGLSVPAPSPTAVATLPPSSGSPAASGSAAASAVPSASAAPTASAGSAGPSTSPAPSAAPSASPAASVSAAPSSSPAASASAGPTASPSSSPAVPAGNTRLPTEGKLGEMVQALQAELGPIAEQSSLTTIGPVVSSDLISQALVLILVGSLGIMVWITLRFRDAKFGVTALVALAHDVVIVIGIFAILGTFFNIKIDALFVTAMLTVIGFSVHDTIVVFDRVRENRARHAGEPFAEIVNHSLLQTFARSITTSFTVFITLLVLLLFGGSAISGFVLALVIGIVSGTYSSIFVASPLLVDWHLWDDRRHGRIASTRTTRVRRAAS